MSRRPSDQRQAKQRAERIRHLRDHDPLAEVRCSCCGLVSVSHLLEGSSDDGVVYWCPMCDQDHRKMTLH